MEELHCTKLSIKERERHVLDNSEFKDVLVCRGDTLLTYRISDMMKQYGKIFLIGARKNRYKPTKLWLIVADMFFY